MRPRIGKLDPTLVRGSRQKITITPATRITSVVLVGTQSITHWVDGGIPRRVVLRPGQLGNTVTFDLPSNANLLPTGYYMLFAMVGDIPSIAQIVRVP